MAFLTASSGVLHSLVRPYMYLFRATLTKPSKNMNLMMFLDFGPLSSRRAAMNILSQSPKFKLMLSIKPLLWQKVVKPIWVTCGQAVSAAISIKIDLSKEKPSSISFSTLLRYSLSLTNFSSFHIRKSCSYKHYSRVLSESDRHLEKTEAGFLNRRTFFTTEI